MCGVWGGQVLWAVERESGRGGAGADAGRRDTEGVWGGWKGGRVGVQQLTFGFVQQLWVFGGSGFQFDGHFPYFGRFIHGSTAIYVTKRT